jgi:protein tyrosine/serine phosphatase
LASVAGPEPELATIRGWTNHCASPLNIQGLPNAFKVTDTLYRGAQPTAEGFEELKKIGIKTVVCLRDHHSDKDLLGDTELKYEAIPLNTWSVKEDDIVRFLKIVTDTNNLPLFVHCQHGADRTGTMVATYRMALCGWKKEDAIDEMVNGGFGFHKTWDNLVDLLRGLDVAALKKKAGITK